MANDPKKIEEQLKRIQKLYTQLGETNPYAGMDPSKIAASTNEVRKLDNALEGIESRVENIGQSFSDLEKQLSATINEIKKGPDATKRLAKGFQGINAEVKKLVYEEEGLDRLNIKQLQNIKKIALQKASDAKSAALDLTSELNLLKNKDGTVKKTVAGYKSLSDVQKAALAFLEKEDETIASINEKINMRIAKEKDLNERMGATGATLKGFESVLNKIGLGDLAGAMDLPGINKELEIFADTGASSQEIFQKGIELSGKAIKKALADPLVQVAIAAKAFSLGFKMSIGALISGMKSLEENSGQLAKNLNIGAQEARLMSANFSKASIGSGKLFVSSKGLAESSAEINESLGTTVRFNAENLATFTALKKTAGLTGEEMMGIQKLSLATGQSFETQADALLTQVDALNESSGIQINSKKVLKEISSLSSATTLSLGQNPKLLGEAVQVAKSLGMEMAKVDAIAGSLLEFESSIEAELSAELLLGKNINLEKARQAALNNDLATVAKEIAKQAGSAAEFGEMNRIQQEALAKAVGMGREDLAETLFIQEQLAGASGIDAENKQKMLESLTAQHGVEKAQEILKAKGLKNLMNQASATEKMQASYGKIDELLQAISSSFAPILDAIASMAAGIAESKGAMAVLVGIMGTFGVMLTVLAGKALYLAGVKIATMFADIISGMSWGGPIGVIGGIALAGGVAATAYGMLSSQKVADGIAPSSKGPFTITDNYGGIATTTKGDSLMASPNVGKSTPQTTTVIDNSEGNKLLAQIAKGLERQKPVPLYQITRS